MSGTIAEQDPVSGAEPDDEVAANRGGFDIKLTAQQIADLGAAGAADSHAWTTEEVVTVPGSQAIAATFPASGSLDTAKEYRIEFNGWELASN